MELTRHHGLGNVFLIALLEELPKDPSGLAQKYCDPQEGIGADGLILGTPCSENSNAVNRFNLFNKDGGRAELSGNGLRCFAQALSMASKLEDDVFHVETDVGLRVLKIEEFLSDNEMLVTAEIGKASFVTDFDFDQLEEKDSKMVRAVKVDIGNPHLIVEVSALDNIDLEQFAVNENENASPEGINVHLMKVDDYSNIRIKTWERGVGITEACGTGACASAFAASNWGLIGSNANVHMPGGTAIVEIGESIELAGLTTFMDRHQVGNG
tara:strand:+ start:15127 stop:15933 length:807 start_codon:yes stop_codon:yes gene_type:complete